MGIVLATVLSVAWRLALLSLLITLPLSLGGGYFSAMASPPESRPLMELVKAGKSCSSERRGLECSYRVGSYFHVSIAALGTAETGIHFRKSDESREIYASFGSMHGCVIVNRMKGVGGFPEFVFISPKNGKVYESWVDCGSAR